MQYKKALAQFRFHEVKTIQNLIVDFFFSQKYSSQNQRVSLLCEHFLIPAIKIFFAHDRITCITPYTKAAQTQPTTPLEYISFLQLNTHRKVINYLITWCHFLRETRVLKMSINSNNVMLWHTMYKQVCLYKICFF